MKHLGQLMAVSTLSLGLCGCASSERMSRMSGGVIQEYSAPQSKRIRSEKFQKHTKAREKARRDLVGKVEDTPVNIWPFFFGSEYYTAIMWPLVDWDEYGFAVRPFYNMEGDEHSVLFPLTAWNVADRDGWVLLFSWHKTGWFFFPLAGRGNDGETLWRYYTPLFIQNNDLRPLSLKNWRRSSFTELMLGYYSHSRELNTDGWSWESLHSPELDDSLKRFLAYKLAGTKWRVPQNKKELSKLRDEVAATLPVRELQSVGFIPLFHVSWDEDGHKWRSLAYLVGGGNTKKRGFEWDVLGPFGMSYENAPPPSPWGRYNSAASEHAWTSILLLSHFGRKHRLIDDGRYKIIRKLYRYAGKRSEPEFRRVLPDLRADLKRLDPALELPATVTDGDTLGLYLDELGNSEHFRDLKLPVHTTYEGGILPLFMYESNDDPKNEDWFFTLAGMSFWLRGEKRRMFWSIPILTCSGKNEFSEWFCIAPPLVWVSNTDFKKRIEVPIHAAETRWAKDGDCVSARGDYSLCGLYYRGHMSCYAAKKGVDHEKAEHIRKELPRLFYGRRDAKKSRAELEKKYRKEEQYRPKPDDEVDACEKQLRLAKLRRELKILAREEADRDRRFARLGSDARKLGFELGGFPKNRKEVDAALERLFDATAELHSQSDAGSGFFYRRESYHNGDYNWHFLGVLAGGEKRGDREHSHVLQFLYRCRRDGRRVEKIYFPFVSIREDEHGSRTSFMGRIWQKTVKDGKSGGYIFFIPYGDL